MVLEEYILQQTVDMEDEAILTTSDSKTLKL